jgi:AraC-like DNA-binding protein
MGLRVVSPAPPLSALVESIWDCDLPRQPHAFERLLPTARAQLVINLDEDETRVYDEALRCTRNAGAVFDAPASRCQLIDTAEQVRAMGVVFHAGAAAVFFRERMDTIADRHVDLEALAPMASSGLRERLLESAAAGARLRILHDWLMRHAPAGAARAPALVHALQLIDAAPGVRLDAVASACGFSPRRLGELFRQQVGLSPKRHARLRRFHGALTAARGDGRIDWAGLAVDAGFHDQAHLVHEFRAFCGMTPTEWTTRRGQWQRHVPLPG